MHCVAAHLLEYLERDFSHEALNTLTPAEAGKK